MRDRIIVALDTDADSARALASSLKGHVGWVKVGMTLYYSCGPGIVADLRDMGFQVFVDLKLHDIPHQVEGASAVLARLGAGMITVHALGGEAMMRAAVQSSRAAAADAGLAPPAVLAVTVLTSMDSESLAAVGVGAAPEAEVAALATLAASAGVDGCVCSPHEAAAVRRILGESALVVTPGVRPAGSEHGDQARVATPEQALRDGASHLVIGRPITGAHDPVVAADHIIEGISS